METVSSERHVLASGGQIILRDRVPSDVDRWIYWRTHGEWRTCEPPWHGLAREFLPPEEEAKLRKMFLGFCAKELPEPRTLAAIARPDGTPIGWVNRYADKDTPDERYIGIGIAEDEYLNRGIGTEALWLWVDYLFSNSDFPRIGLSTWSLNPRMMHVAEKVGFVREGVLRQVREWEGERFDNLSYGMLRREWEEIRARYR